MTTKHFIAITAITFTTFINNVKAQTKDSTKTVDLFADIENESKNVAKNAIDYTTATFKSTRIVNGHTIETIGKYNLDFRISHRFGMINSGAYNLFGLDNATMRIGLDYGVTNRLMIGLGRNNYEKEIDAFIKYKLLRQSTGKVNMPISVTLVSTAMHYGLKTTPELSFSNRMAYAHQILIARKFNDAVSFQLMPSYVHINVVDSANQKNDYLSVGIGGRVKISKRVALTAEFFPQLNALPNRANSLSIGVDIETGGHVFQLHFTNSTGMTERSVITNTLGDWGDGGIHFGFNITRLFTLKKSEGSRAGW